MGPIVIPFELKATFLRELDEGLKKARSAFEALRVTADDPVALDEISRFFHRIAGTAHSVEFPTLGRVGMLCESLADFLKECDGAHRGKALELFADGLAAVEELLDEHRASSAERRAPAPLNAQKILREPTLSRVLVIDDDPFSAKLVDTCLRAAGFVSASCSEPEQALEIVESELPDLVILDVVMPGVDGFELCRRIRKNPALAFTPIIFVTRKGDVEGRVRGLEVGGNDYIAKPFDPQELVARVRSHLQRLAALQDMAIRDGLTRCFNHKYFKLRVEQELARSRRYHAPFCIALADADHFKFVNDTYGHQAGDAALGRLANLVVAGVRGSDVVARYFGEQFGLLLIESGLKEATLVTDRLRARIASELFTLPEPSDGSPAPSVPMTVSIGVTEVQATDTVESLLQRAGAALAEAKSAGRNTVRTATG
ncbi:MAG TPA: diguanylate cyclase [Myxococcales bacterium]|jgi:diguanylate cyclase (GGDEF)-like protein